MVGNRLAGFVATISATVWFDYFLTQPYGRLAITHRADVETAVSLLVVGVIVTELAARNRYHHATAAEEADFVGLIHDVTGLATSGASSRLCTLRALGGVQTIRRHTQRGVHDLKLLVATSSEIPRRGAGRRDLKRNDGISRWIQAARIAIER